MKIQPDIRFGKLITVSKTERKNTAGCYFWLVKCDCGNELEVVSNSLSNGVTTSCGCFKKEVAKKAIRKTPNYKKHIECRINKILDGDDVPLQESRYKF